MELYQHFVAESEFKMNKLSLMEVIIKAVDDIKDPTEAHEFLDKFQPKVTSIEIQFSIRKKNTSEKAKQNFNTKFYKSSLSKLILSIN